MNDKKQKSTEEIYNELGRAVFKDNYKNYGFEKGLFKNEEIKKRWLILPIIPYLICCAIFLWLLQPNTNCYTFMFIIGILLIAWLSTTTHLKFKNKIVTSITGITLFIGLIIAAGLITPSWVVKKIENYFTINEELPVKSDLITYFWRTEE